MEGATWGSVGGFNHTVSEMGIFYRLRFAFYIWRHMPYCTIRRALNYPLPVSRSDNPESDAAAEIDWICN